MYLARVVGTVTATVKAEGLRGQKLLLVEPLDTALQVAGARHVAVDVAQAGPGDLVTCVGSREAALACDPWFVPVDAAIIGIVDAVDTVTAPADAARKRPRARRNDEAKP